MRLLRLAAGAEPAINTATQVAYESNGMQSVASCFDAGAGHAQVAPHP
jgi:hypothetical protein